MQRLVITHAQIYWWTLITKQKLGQFDLVYWVYGSFATSWVSLTMSCTNAARKNFMALCFIEMELLWIRILHCGNRDFFTFSAVNMTWTWWPSRTSLIHITWRYTGCAKINFLRRSSQSYIVLQTCRQTHRLMLPKLYTTPLCGWSIKSDTLHRVPEKNSHSAIQIWQQICF